MSDMTRICNKCNRTFPFTSNYFHRSSRRKDGLLTTCKSCQCKATQKWANQPHAKAAKRAYRVKNTACHAEYNRKYRLRNPGYSTENARAWRRNNPDGAIAHNRLWKAIIAGRIIRQSCEICDEPKTHAHHDDYSKPYDVRWLCAKHHGAHHAIRARGTD